MSKKIITTILVLTALLVLLTSCSPATEPAASASSSSEASASASAGSDASASAPAEESGEKTFTVEELATYDGKDGNAAYIAVDGVVYDVSDVGVWANGEHQGKYSAGKDLTEEIKNESPHGVSKLEGLPVVGTLAE